MIRWRDLEGDLTQSGPGWPPQGRNLPDLERLLEIHGDDGSGYCAAGCNKRGWQYPAGTCTVAEYAAGEKRRLLAERANGY